MKRIRSLLAFIATWRWLFIPVTLLVCLNLGLLTRGLSAERYDQPVFRGAAETATITGARRSVLQQSFELRRNHYEETAQRLSFTIVAMAFLSLLVIVILVARPKTIELPIVGIRFSTTFAYWVLPAVFVYLWLQFGFLLFSAVESRVALYEMSILLEADSSGEPALNSPFRLYHGLEDTGIVDAWTNFFLSHYDYVDERVSKWTVGIALYGVFGTIFGIVQANTLLLLRAGSIRVRTLRTPLHAAMVGAIAIFALSHLAFFIQLRYAFSLQLWMVSSACWSGLLLSIHGGHESDYVSDSDEAARTSVA